MYKLVDHNLVNPNWIPSDLFWYKILTPAGSEFVLVNPAKGTRTVAADKVKLIEAVSAASGGKTGASFFKHSSTANRAVSMSFYRPMAKKQHLSRNIIYGYEM